MNIGGLVSFTTIDFPERLSAVVFCQGCPNRCPFCHNPELQSADKKGDIPWNSVLDLLTQRKNLLDGVVFSGGEPLLQPDLDVSIRQVKELGYAVALHTSGVLPDALQKVLPDVEWIGLDIKSDFSKYAAASGTSENLNAGQNVLKSLDLILASGIDFEVRTTTDPRIVSKEDILNLAEFLSKKGVKSYALQEYRPVNNPNFKEPPIQDIKSFYLDLDFLQKVGQFFDKFEIRTAN